LRSSTGGWSLVEVLTTIGILAVLAGMSAPLLANAIAFFRVSGDARSVSNAIAVVKIRAASDFTQARLYADLSAKTHHPETWDKTTGTWKREGGDTTLSTTVAFGYSGVTNPPPNTQGVIKQALACKDKDGNDIGNTSCVIFNSRGVPVDTSGAPTATHALYVTDGANVYGVTVSATGMVRNWRAATSSIASWTQQ
jgi:Tfp pilus assembly protein FimT